MSSSSVIPRKLIVFGIVVPLAAVLGYSLATPNDWSTWLLIGGVVAVMCVPVLIRWHHIILVGSWYAAVTLGFLPGSPPLWMAMAGISFGIAILNRLLDKQSRLLQVRFLTWTLVMLAATIILTALMNGVGIRSFGSSTYGGRRYVELLVAILGYFALSFQRIPIARGAVAMSVFVLANVSTAMSNLIYMAGPAFYGLYLIFPVNFAVSQAYADYMGAEIKRVMGFAFACTGAFYYLLARFGIRGLFEFSKPWRMGILLMAIAASLAGGFRSIAILFGLLFLVQFYLEGLHRTRLFGALLISGVLVFAGLIPFANRLPLSMQRSLSFLPIPVDPVARYDAENSTNWRLYMWRLMLPELPKYAVFGRGYKINPTDLYFAYESFTRGLASDVETALVAGDYHNGPLSIYVPFGSVGLLAFLAFIVAGFRLLLSNYRYCDPRLKTINTFLFAYFVTRAAFFLFIFGGISGDLYHFTGVVGLSVSLNGGICRKSEPGAAVESAPSQLQSTT